MVFLAILGKLAEQATEGIRATFDEVHLASLPPEYIEAMVETISAAIDLIISRCTSL